MYSQDEMARELYEGRLKAERDAKMRHTEMRQALAQLAAAKQQGIEAEQRRSEAEQRTLHERAKRIQLCERLLARPISDTSALVRRSTSALQELADGLAQELEQAQ